MSRFIRGLLPRTIAGVVILCAALAMPGVVGVASAESSRFGEHALRFGDRGPNVKKLQGLLTKAGIEVKGNGRFDQSTKEAVTRFQVSARLDQSGVAGRKTIAALRRVGNSDGYESGGFDANGSVGSTRSLGDRIPVVKGMSGHDVKVLQDFLRRAGVKKVPVDGEFRVGTLQAVKAFEKAQKLPVDGVVDAGDIEVLRGQADPVAPVVTSAPEPLALAAGDRAKLTAGGLARAPASAPDAVKKIIAAGNKIATKPYLWGGGHAKWEDKGYDCSGSVSYALYGAGLLKAPLVSGDFPNWGAAGAGQWVTLYGNSGHGYMVVAGLRFDTSGAKQTGSRWQTAVRPTKGYGVSHPAGL